MAAFVIGIWTIKFSVQALVMEIYRMKNLPRIVEKASLVSFSGLRLVDDSGEVVMGV